VGGLENVEIVDPPKMVTSPSRASANRARCSVTLLMWPTPLPIHQTSHQWYYSIGRNGLTDQLNWFETRQNPTSAESAVKLKSTCHPTRVLIYFIF